MLRVESAFASLYAQNPRPPAIANPIHALNTMLQFAPNNPTSGR